MRISDLSSDVCSSDLTAITYTERSRVAGERLFDVFPDNPDLEDATGVAGLFDSIRIAAQGRRQHAMKAQRYDLRGSDGRFLERYWQTVSVPRSEEHTSELQSLMRISYAVFCLKKK